jgi:acetylxylan esterase
MMTNVLLGAYPDVFVAGAAFGGVPFGGFATDSGNWNDDCAKGLLNRTGRDWGDIVRAAFPGYEGRRARVQLWHSTTDDILDHRNIAGEPGPRAHLIRGGAIARRAHWSPSTGSGAPTASCRR